MINATFIDKGDLVIIPLSKINAKRLIATGSSIEEKQKLLTKYGQDTWQFLQILKMVESKNFKTNTDKLIAETVAHVRTILDSGSQCAKFFGQNAAEALNVMESRLKRETIDNLETSPLGIRMKTPQTFNADRVIKYVIYLEEGVNATGPFYNSKSKARLGNYSPNTNRSRALQILHELAHAVHLNGQPLIPVDGNNDTLSEKNTKYLLDDQKCQCRAEIDKIKD